jgi:hypothetical protein
MALVAFVEYQEPRASKVGLENQSGFSMKPFYAEVDIEIAGGTNTSTLLLPAACVIDAWAVRNLTDLVGFTAYEVGTSNNTDAFFSGSTDYSAGNEGTAFLATSEGGSGYGITVKGTAAPTAAGTVKVGVWGRALSLGA